MTRLFAALIGVLSAVVIGCGGPGPAAAPDGALEAEPSAVLAQAVQAMEDNPRFGIVVGYIDSQGEPYPAVAFGLEFVLPDRLFCQRGPGYESVPFMKIIAGRTYASPDGMHWEELGRDTGAEWYPAYYVRWDPYEFLINAGNATDGGTASVDGKLCRVIEADVDMGSWGNNTLAARWVTDKMSVALVVYADAASYLPHRLLVKWRQEYPQGTTEYPYAIDIIYDETIAIEPPEEVLTKDELQDIAFAMNPVIEECAGDLIRILSAYEAEYGRFPDKLDLETVGGVMRAAGLEWPTNPSTGAPMADDEAVPGNFFYLPLEDGGDYQLSVLKVAPSYTGGLFTYYGVPPGPTVIPKLTDEQKEKALEVALADPRVQELLEGRPYDVGGVGVIHMGSKLVGATVSIDLKEPCIIEYDWPSGAYPPSGGPLVEVTRHETVGVETLKIDVNLEEEVVLSIQPLSFHIFR